MLYTFETSKKFKAQEEVSGSADLQNIKFFPVFPFVGQFSLSDLYPHILLNLDQILSGTGSGLEKSRRRKGYFH
jgi:hypothetical protein